MDILQSYKSYLRYELNRSKLTVDAYMSDMQQFIDFLLRNEGERGAAAGDEERSGEIERLLIGADMRSMRRWLAELATGTGTSDSMQKGKREGDSTSTLRRKAQSLRSFYRYLLRRGDIRQNPAADLVLAKGEKTLPEFVREDEIEKVLTAPEGEEDYISFRNRMIVSLLYTTGMRRAELIALEDADVDLAGMQLKVTGKRNKQRMIPFGERTRRELEEYLRRRDMEERESGAARVCSKFFTHNGRGITTNRLTAIVKELLQGTSVSKKSPHVLRHTFATTLLNNGAEINSVKSLLGHSSIATTQIYTHLSFSELRKNYQGAHPRERSGEEKK